MTSVQFSSFAYLALLLTFFIIHQVTGGRRVEVYRFCAGYSFDSLSGQTGKYTIEKGPHSGVTCTWPGPSGSSYHLKWQHGDLEGGHEYHLPYNSKLIVEYEDTTKTTPSTPEPPLGIHSLQLCIILKSSCRLGDA
uniref:Uncharacterized protein n=1 Tax=Glossina brevipalpis TaxID=37001 RepID=A0A1A9W731_9MUSC